MKYAQSTKVEMSNEKYETGVLLSTSFKNVPLDLSDTYSHIQFLRYSGSHSSSEDKDKENVSDDDALFQ
nr:9809_t:CDS:2 [Entrophospora candida]